MKMTEKEKETVTKLQHVKCLMLSDLLTLEETTLQLVHHYLDTDCDTVQIYIDITLAELRGGKMPITSRVGEDGEITYRLEECNLHVSVK